MTSDRIERAQQEIARYLPPRRQYVVNTSEFDQIKLRLTRLMDNQDVVGGSAHPTLRTRPQVRSDGNDNGGPTLRKRPPQ